MLFSREAIGAVHGPGSNPPRSKVFSFSVAVFKALDNSCLTISLYRAKSEAERTSIWMVFKYVFKEKGEVGWLNVGGEREMALTSLPTHNLCSRIVNRGVRECQYQFPL